MALENQDKSYLFTFLGFRSLASQSPLGDLLKYRLICRDWNEVVQKVGLFKKAHVTFDPDWIQRELIPFHNSSLEPRKWINVKLNRTRLPSASAHLYLNYWKYACESLKILDVYRVQVTCGNLCKIINLSPNLEEIIINHVRFVHQDSQRTVREPDRYGRQRDVEKNDRTFCSCFNNENGEHEEDLMGSIFAEKDQVQLNTHPSLKKIKLLGFFALPCPLLEVLEIRSKGLLVEFKIIKWFKQPKKVTGNLFPSNIRQRGWFLRIIRGSQDCLTTFHFVDNDARESSMLFLAMIPPAATEGQVAIPRLQLQEIEIKKEQDMVENQFGQIQRQIPIPFNQRAIQLIENQAFTCLKLKLSLAFGQHFDDFQHLMTHPQILEKLQSFELYLIGGITPRPVLNFFGRLRVVHLALCDSKGQTPRHFVNNFNNGALTQLPRLTSFKLRLLSCNPTQISEVLNNQNLTGLTSLEFICSRQLTFKDENLHLIFTNMPRLKKLHILNASCIHEFGITGLRQEVVVELQKSKIFHGQPSDYDENIVGPNLRQLEDLEDLSLKGCLNVGSVSLFFGILLPKLKKLDLSECPNVSDTGIQFVGRNLNLKHLIIRKNIKLTYYGINQLVKDYPHLRKIYTSKATIGRKIQVLESNEHPFFSQVVKSYSEVVREPKMENKVRRKRNRQ